jgi:hypothetical protein
VPFDVFMSRKIEKCEKKNLDVKNVFAHAHNRLCHDDTHRCQIEGSKPSSAAPAREDPPSSLSPLTMPKVEVIDLTEEAEYEYMYKRPS